MSIESYWKCWPSPCSGYNNQQYSQADYSQQQPPVVQGSGGAYGAVDAYGQPIGETSASGGGYGHHQGQAYGGGGKWLASDPSVDDHSKPATGYY